MCNNIKLRTLYYCSKFRKSMSSEEAIKKLETSNQGLKVILEHLNEQLTDMRLDPRLEGLMDDLENLFYAYLKTWIKSNSEVIDILKKDIT